MVKRSVLSFILFFEIPNTLKILIFINHLKKNGVELNFLKQVGVKRDIQPKHK